jgi:hypothetical protein
MSHSILRLIGAAQTFDREKISRYARANEGFECREEVKMQKTTLALLAAALVTVSIVQPGAATQSQRSHRAHQAPVAQNWQWRASKAYLPSTAQPAPFQYDEALSPPAGH